VPAPALTRFATAMRAVPPALRPCDAEAAQARAALQVTRDALALQLRSAYVSGR
jgi:hypothetical protein